MNYILSLIEVDEGSGVTYSWYLTPLAVALLRAQLGPAQVEAMFGPEHLAEAVRVAERMPVITNIPNAP